MCHFTQLVNFVFFNCLAVVKLNPAFKKPLFLEKRASELSFNWSEAKVLVKVSLKRVNWRTSEQNVGNTNESMHEAAGKY